MAKAAPSKFADAKRRAVRAFSQQAPDGFVPDRVMFFNDDLGFIVRLYNTSDDHHVQRIVSWNDVAQARIEIVERTVLDAVENLARAQGETI